MTARALVSVVALATACVPASRSLERVRAAIAERTGDEVTLPDVEHGGDDERLDALLRGPIGGDEAAAIAMLASPEVRAALEELGIARADVLSASLPPNPEIDSEMRLGRGGGGDEAGDEVEAHVVIDLAALIARPLRRAAAEAELGAAELEAADVVMALTFAARVRLVELQAAERRRALWETTVAVTRAARETAAALFEAGNVPHLLVATEEAMHADARLGLSRAELEVLEAREAAAVAMGLSGEHVGFALATTLPEPDAEAPVLSELEVTAVTNSLSLASARQELEALARRHGLARTEGLLPEVLVGVSGSYAGQALAFGPAFTITLPLFDQGIGRTDRIEAELRTAEERYEAEAIRVRSRVRRARNRLLSLRAQAVFLSDEVVPARRAVLEDTLLMYNAMAATPFALLAARRAMIEAELELVDALREHAIAAAALDAVLAGASVDPAAGSASEGAAPARAAGGDDIGHD